MERAPSDEPVLAIDDLVATYDEDEGPVLPGTAARIWDGVTVVEGPAGAGKTTLWRAIVGLRPPRVRGSIRFLGSELLRRHVFEVSRLGIAGAAQRPKLYPALPVDEQLTLVDPKAVRAGSWTVARAYEAFPELAARRTVPAGQLSGGEQRMLGIARALVANPRLLVIDEPFQALDPVARARVADLITTFAASGAAVLVLGRPERVSSLPATYGLRMDDGVLVPAPPSTRVAAP